MFNIIKYKTLFIFIALVSMLFSTMILFSLGLKPGIDFTGGTVTEIKAVGVNQVIDNPSDWIRAKFEEQGIEVSSVQESEGSVYIVKSKATNQETWASVLASLREEYEATEELSFETIGPLLGEELLQKTLYAVLLATIALLIYIAWRFENRLYGITAVIAMIHDVLLILAAFALFGRLFSVEVDVMFVTATLTALAFSVHDTIVLYDRVREVQRRKPNNDFADTVNLAINATLVRSLSTSLTLVFVLMALIVLGGETIRWFIVALLVGTVTGAYSSPFIAAPLVVILQKFKRS